MNTSLSKSLHQMADGTLWGFLAEALILPTGLIVAAYLTRHLGPEEYGLFTLAATLIGWVTFSTTSLFSRTAIKFLSEAKDWRPVGTAVLRLHLATGVGAALLVFLAAEPISILLDEPKLKIYLQLFSLEPLLFVLAKAHRIILIGTGRFRQQAISSGVRWIVRLLLIVFLVEIGLSIGGAILGTIGASLIELIICRFYTRPRLFSPSVFPARELWNYATPLFLSAIAMQLFHTIDLFALTALGGTAKDAGIYGAAQNLSIVPGLFAMSFSPLLLSSLGQMLKNGQKEDAQNMASNAMRLTLGMVPFAAMTSGAAQEMVVLIFGEAFTATAPLLSVLIFGKAATVMIAVATTIFISIDRPNLTLVIAYPVLIIAGIGHLFLIPHFGAVGASWVTTVVAIGGALSAMIALYSLWRVSPPLSTALRCLVVSGLAYSAAIFWPTPGFWVVPKLIVIIAMIALGFVLLGEFSKKERALLWSFFQSQALREQKS